MDIFQAPQILILDSISWNLIKARGLRVYLRIFFRNFFGYHFLEGFARVQQNSDSSEIGLFQDYFNAEPRVPSSKQNKAQGLPNWAHLISAHQWKFFKMFLSTSYLLQRLVVSSWLVAKRTSIVVERTSVGSKTTPMTSKELHILLE